MKLPLGIKLDSATKTRFDMPNIELNGISLFYEKHGKGEPLLLIPGMSADGRTMTPVSKLLAKHFTVIIPDNRGCGKTLPHDASNSIELMADDCVLLLQHLGIDSFHVAGHSMGGFIALDLAARYPSLVRRLVLANCHYEASARNKILYDDFVAYLESGMDLRFWHRNIFYWLFSNQFFASDDILEMALDYTVEHPERQTDCAFIHQVEALKEYQGREKLSHIQAPTLVVGADQDILYPPHLNQDLAKRISDARFHLIENCAHATPVEQPELFGQIIADHCLCRDQQA